jgi:hypothetical protein
MACNVATGVSHDPGPRRLLDIESLHRHLTDVGHKSDSAPRSLAGQRVPMWSTASSRIQWLEWAPPAAPANDARRSSRAAKTKLGYQAVQRIGNPCTHRRDTDSHARVVRRALSKRATVPRLRPLCVRASASFDDRIRGTRDRADHIRTADDTDQLAVAQDRHTLDAVAHHQLREVSDAGPFASADHGCRH